MFGLKVLSGFNVFRENNRNEKQKKIKDFKISHF